jgi:hypothetical protein
MYSRLGSTTTTTPHMPAQYLACVAAHGGWRALTFPASLSTSSRMRLDCCSCELRATCAPGAQQGSKCQTNMLRCEREKKKRRKLQSRTTCGPAPAGADAAAEAAWSAVAAAVRSAAVAEATAARGNQQQQHLTQQLPPLCLKTARHNCQQQ